MSHASAPTRRQGFRSRSVPGLVAAFWLNLAMQPCALAMAGHHGCAFCPPAAATATQSHHHGHDAGPVGAEHCASLVKPCGQTGAVGVDGRDGPAKYKDTTQPDAGPVPTLAGIDLVPTGFVYRSTAPPTFAGASPPLHVLHCVYLK